MKLFAAEHSCAWIAGTVLIELMLEAGGAVVSCVVRTGRHWMSCALAVSYCGRLTFVGILLQAPITPMFQTLLTDCRRNFDELPPKKCVLGTT